MPPSTGKQPQLLIGAGILAAVLAALAGGIILGSRSTQEPLTQPQTEVTQLTTAPATPTVARSTPPPPPAPPIIEPPPPPRVELRKKTINRPATVTPAPQTPPLANATQLERMQQRLAALASATDQPNRLRDLRQLGMELATGITPDQLQYWLSELPDGAGKQMLVRGYVEGLSQTDPRAAAEQSAEIAKNLAGLHGFNASQTMTIIMNAWGKTAPAEAAAWTANLKAGTSECNAAWHAIAQQWAISAPDSALAWSIELGAAGAPMTRRIAQIIGQKDAESAVQRLFDMQEGPARDAYLAGVASAWIRLDAKTALEAVSTIADQRQRTSATHQAVVHWAHVDPAAAASWTAQNASPRLKNSLQQNIARSWASRDPIAALAWAASQEDLNLRETLVSAAAPQAVWRDSELAIKTVESLPEGRPRNNAVSRLVSNWAQRDPAKAAQFAASADVTADSRHTTVADASYQWGRRSPADAAAWAATLPNDGNKWNAVMGAASGASKFSNGQITSQWWTSMRKESLNAETVRTWLNRPEVPQKVREQFLPLTEE